jgi:hypothetical protein
VPRRDSPCSAIALATIRRSGRALRRVERGRGRFFQHLLVAALQRAVALAQMDRVAVAVAEHLNLDVARIAEIFLDIDGVVAERGLGLGAAGAASGVSSSASARHDLHAAPAAAGGGLDEHRIADLPWRLLRLGNVGDAARRSRAPPACRARPRCAWPRSCRPSMRICSGLGPMKVMPCASTISANWRFPTGSHSRDGSRPRR